MLITAALQVIIATNNTSKSGVIHIIHCEVVGGSSSSREAIISGNHER